MPDVVAEFTLQAEVEEEPRAEGASVR